MAVEILCVVSRRIHHFSGPYLTWGALAGLIDNKEYERENMNKIVVVILMTLGSPVFAATAAKVESLFTAMNMDKFQNDAIEAMVKMQVQQNPELGKIQKEFHQFFLKHLSWKAIKAEVTPLYEKAFTDEEISKITAFYQSPTGKKALAEMPALMAKGAEIGQRRVQENLPDFFKSVEGKLKK